MSKMSLNREDSLLDLGCGEGSVTLAIAKKVAKVTAIDSSENMLELLKEKCEKEELANVDIVQGKLEEMKVEDLGNYDIVLSSRSFNGIHHVKQAIVNISEIASKYVYITLFGPNNWKFEKKFYESIGKEYHEFPPYNYLVNILIEMGIYPNVENLEIESSRTYESVHEAMNNGRWKLDSFTDDEKIKLRSYLKEKLKLNEEGKLENPEDKSAWILIWWKKDWLF
jgi:ubiquinone/menaquinone biosynthesis C-methylase UbiE